MGITKIGLTEYHTPVLLEESLKFLQLKPGGVYVDATFGGGGHSAAIHRRLGRDGRLVVFDQDPEAGTNPLLKQANVLFCPANFRYLKNWLAYGDVRKVDGILADLGVSSFQLDQAERGMSYKDEAVLDMRMNPAQKLTAYDVLNSYNAEELQEIFSKYGELRNSRSLAKAVISHREAGGKFKDVQGLLTIVNPLIMGSHYKYLAQLFQAIRIEVNDEIGALRKLLQTSKEILAEFGRLVIISYHSIEDRQVKSFMRYCNFEMRQEKDDFGHPERCFKVLTKKPVVPAQEEQKRNPRSRSAKLRAAQRLPHTNGK